MLSPTQSYKGVPQNEIGIRTDVLDNVSKSTGLKMLIRSMSPKVISTDEIGDIKDVEAIQYGICCGIKGIFTAHGNNLNDISLNPALKSLIEMYVFDRIITLDKSKVDRIGKIYRLDKNKKEYII